MAAFLQQDARHIGGYAKTDIDRVSGPHLLRHPASHNFLDTEFGKLETGQGAEDFARYRGVIDSIGGLGLIGGHHNDIHQHARHQHIVRSQGARLRQPFDLRNHQPAVVAHSQRLIQRAENAALMLVG